ncbi:MAG: O-antigen ligase family protein [Bacteroidota bacterium]
MEREIKQKINIRVKSAESKILEKKISLIALFFVVVQFLNNSIFLMMFPFLNVIIQVALYGSMGLILVSSYPKFSFQSKTALLILGTAISLTVNNVDAKYGSGIRWVLWLLLLASIGPMFSGKLLLKIRYKVLQYFLKSFVIITLLSFLYKLFGLPAIGRGNFAGLMNQSMVLGPIAAIAGIYSFYNYLSAGNKKLSLYYLVISLISGLVVVFASSRLAFAGYIAGMMFLFVKPFKFRIIYSMTIILIGLSIFSRIDDGIEKVERSIDKGLVEKGMNNSREMLWEDRIREFKENPVFGVGFSAQNDLLIKSENSLGGRIEPGSGYLMILSMTGVFGLLMFIWYFYFLFNNRKFWKEIYKSEIYKLSIFAFFAIHFIGEGYVYSAGSMMAAFFWLLVGITFPYENIKKYNIVQKRGK